MQRPPTIVHFVAPKPYNWEALVACWADPAAFARESALYANQVAEEGTVRVVEHLYRGLSDRVDACSAGHRWHTEEHAPKRTCLRCTAQWHNGEPEPLTQAWSHR